jgi:endonuclease/exonuclease/phosphatase (EEP) superfamily protein YafD
LGSSRNSQYSASLSFLLFGVGRPGPAAAALVVAGLAVAGASARAAPSAAALAGDANVKIVWANVYYQDDSLARAVAFARAENADLLLIAERPEVKGGRRLAAAPDYPFRDGSIAGADTAIAVYSRSPLADVAPTRSPGRNGLVFRAALRDGRMLFIGAVHPTIPKSPRATAVRRRQIADVFALAAREESALLLGDFNTVPWSPDLIDVAKGAGARRVSTRSSTWISKLPGFGLPIDLVFVAGGAAARAEVGPAIGSDHFPLLVEADAAPTPETPAGGR